MIFFPLILLPAGKSNVWDQWQGTAQKKLQRSVMSAKLSLARQKSRKTRKIQVKNGEDREHIVGQKKTQWGVQEAHRWLSRKPDSRNKGFTRREQWGIDGEIARWRPAQQPGFLLLMRHAEGLLPEPCWPLQLWAGLPAARCWTRPDLSKHLACPAS